MVQLDHYEHIIRWPHRLLTAVSGAIIKHEEEEEEEDARSLIDDPFCRW